MDADFLSLTSRGNNGVVCRVAHSLIDREPFVKIFVHLLTLSFTLNNLYGSDCYNLWPAASGEGGGSGGNTITIMNINIRVYLITLISLINTSLINLC